eukprot:8224484-Pyramimonas_sp.AAC.1
MDIERAVGHAAQGAPVSDEPQPVPVRAQLRRPRALPAGGLRKRVGRSILRQLFWDCEGRGHAELARELRQI